ncbi:MAG: hypothetical protein ABI441_10820 [Flavobacterium sp.]
MNWWDNFLFDINANPTGFKNLSGFLLNLYTFIIQNYSTMGTLEIKLEIFDKLKNIEDLTLLEKIKNLLNSADSSKVYQLEQYEIDMIKESEEDLKYGRVISQEDLDKEDLEWLSK